MADGGAVGCRCAEHKSFTHRHRRETNETTCPWTRTSHDRGAWISRVPSAYVKHIRTFHVNIPIVNVLDELTGLTGQDDLTASTADQRAA